MPRRPSPAHPSIGRAVESLVLAIGGLVSTVAATVHSARDIGHAATDVKVAVKKQRGPGKGNPKLKAALKKSWAGYTPKQRAERVRKMLAGRGIKAKGAAASRTVARKAAARRVAARKLAAHAAVGRKVATRRTPKVAARKVGSAWASMTPEQRAERVAKMQAGRSKAIAVVRPARETSLLND